ncbi:hypothetical protein SISSUDRAFT_1133511 [Sistotremastrum suecicum HHB10207 ss-3]|uniref:F-box domain-containing protein n=1 Tax=Sistotremastrum suecicum HHB10207 ss-3 TaxID=1314776 RepID=A0A165X2D0_9AGAM|nr:hypothetical protein SISSUDRAFT_1133511 [Sistotremastrum suecicum HHB10207 ss-3]
MATFNDLSLELCTEIVMNATLEVVVNLSQTSSAFRALIQSDKRILTSAFYTHPFDLPAGTTPNDPPSNFLSLCVEAVRASERLQKADITTVLKPQGQRSIALPDLDHDEIDSRPRKPASHPPFIFGDIVVYWSAHELGSFIIADVTNQKRRVDTLTEHIVENLNKFLSSLFDSKCP